MESSNFLSRRVESLWKMPYGAEPPIWLRFRSSTWLICFTIFLTTFTDGFVYGIIVPVFPFSLVERSGIPEHEIQFWISTFLVLHGMSMAVVSPIAGWLADRSSVRRYPFLGGLGMLFLSTLLFAIGTSPVVLVVARCLQGGSAGVVYTVGLAILVDTVGRDEIGSWIGFVLSGMTSGVMVGPLLGGLLYEKVGYYGVFVITLAVIAFDFMLPLFMIEKRVAQKWLESPRRRNGYGTIGDQQNDHHVSKSASTIGGQESENFESGPSCDPQDEQDSLINEIRGRDSQDPGQKERPVATKFLAERFPIPYALMSSPRLVAAMYGGFVQVALICSFDSILPLFVHRTFEWGPSAVGLIFLSISTPSLAGPLVGILSDRLGSRIVVLGGFALSTLSLILLSLVALNNIEQKVLLGVLLAMTGKVLFRLPAALCFPISTPSAAPNPCSKTADQLALSPDGANYTGLSLTMILSPLAADMFCVVEQMSIDNEGLFGANGAYARAYGIFDTALAMGTMLGPMYAGLVYEKAGWRPVMFALAAFCATGSIPVLYFTGTKVQRSRGVEGHERRCFFQDGSLDGLAD